MARYSPAKPFCATAANPRLSRRRRQLAANATSPSMPANKARLPALSKPAKPPPPPPLLSRPKLPVPTTTSDTAGDKHDHDNEKPQQEAKSAPPSRSGAGDVLRLMDALGVPPDEEVYISLLRDCANAAEVVSVHAHIASAAAGGLPLPLANRLLLSYAACGDLAAARQMFDGMPARNGMAWATMVSAYSDACFHQKAMRLFVDMCHEVLDLAGDCYAHAFVAVLRSCARAGELRLGAQVHALAVKKDRVCGNTGSALVQLYCESSSLHGRARRVLLVMVQHHGQEPVPEAAWTSLITACHRDGLLNEAIDVFRDMVSAGVPRGSFSLSSILAVLAESENHQGCCGRQVHADAIKRGVDANQFVGSGLVHLYAKRGRLADAARAFQAIGGEPDAVCWNAMAMAYARGGRYREAARVLYRMKAAGMNPSEEMTDAVRLACFR